MEKTVEEIKELTSNISLILFGTVFSVRVERDCIHGKKGRIFIQITYVAPCAKTGKDNEWHGRKWYLSDHMTDDEIVKTAFTAFKMAVEHEVMESFKFAGVTVFNPHVNYQELISISHKEVARK